MAGRGQAVTGGGRSFRYVTPDLSYERAFSWRIRAEIRQTKSSCTDVGCTGSREQQLHTWRGSGDASALTLSMMILFATRLYRGMMHIGVRNIAEAHQCDTYTQSMTRSRKKQNGCSCYDGVPRLDVIFGQCGCYDGWCV